MTFNAVVTAQSLVEEIARRANEIEAARRLPADLAQKFAAAGLFRMLLPPALGGHQTAPTELAQALETLGQADASAAWCVMIGATTAALANRLPPAVAREVFAAESVIAAGVFAPMGRAVDDGDHWTVTGRWQWGSGSQNANWIAGGAVLMGPDGPLKDDDGQPRHRMMIFRADEVELLSAVPRVPYGVISNRHGKGALPGEFPETPKPTADASAANPSAYNNVSVFTPIRRPKMNGR